MRRAAILLVALSLAACNEDDGPGSPSASSETTASTASGESTTSVTRTGEEAEPSPIALRGDGLGVVDLGGRPDDAIAAVTAELGEPATDSGWQPTTTSFTTCPGDRVREVKWDGLVLLFTDGATDEGAGEHLFGWQVVGPTPPIATAQGLGYGATAVDAQELYEGMVERVPAEEPFPAFLRIAAEGGQITAYLDDTDTITNLAAGTGCGE